MSVKLTQMRHFVVLAEELHFGHAANKLGMSQPPLSQSIGRLETYLGFQLINRRYGGLTLTPAGETFLHQARLVLRQADILERNTRRTATGVMEVLSMGFVEPSLFQLVPAALAHFQKQTDGVRLRLEEHTSSIQINMLLRGELDLGIILPPPTPVLELETRIVESCPLVACVPASSPLARRKSISLLDLADETFIMHPAAVPSTGRDLPVGQSGRILRFERQFILAACRQAGFEPRTEGHSLRTLTVISLIAAGMGIGFFPESARRRKFEGVAFLPVAELDGLTRQLMIGWRAGDVPRPLQGLIDALSIVDDQSAVADDVGDRDLPPLA